MAHSTRSQITTGRGLRPLFPSCAGNWAEFQVSWSNGQSLSGHVTSFFCENESYLWFCVLKTISGPYLEQNEQVVRSWSRSQTVILLRLWVASFWTQILHWNKSSTEMLKRWCGNIYSTSERNHQTFIKIYKSGTTLLKNRSAIKYLP